MQLSTRGRYGVRAMCDLAEHYGQGPVGIKAIAQRQQLSEMYLEQLLAALRKQQLVKTVRGARGGYELGRPPNEISIGEILRVTEGDFAPCQCAHDAHDCENAQSCSSRQVWVRMYQSMSQVVDEMTLQDLLTENGPSIKDAPTNENNTL